MNVTCGLGISVWTLHHSFPFYLDQNMSALVLVLCLFLLPLYRRFIFCTEWSHIQILASSVPLCDVTFLLPQCGTWSLALREDRKLRRIFGPKRDEATREWSKLHNEEINDLYSSPNIIRVTKSRRMRWARRVTRIKEKERYINGFGEATWEKQTTWETQA